MTKSILKDTNYIDEKFYASIISDCNEIIAMPVSTVKTSKKNKTETE